MDERELTGVLTRAYGMDTAVRGLARDGGGASRITSAFDAVTADGRRHPLILREATLGLSNGIPLAMEAALMRSAAAAGVPTPQVVAVGPDYVVMARVEGETIPRRILREPALAGVRAGLAAECGRILAAVHRMAAPAGLAEGDPIAQWREALDLTGEPHPAIELGLRRLELTRPDSARSTVVHGDFRNGNLMVAPDGVRAVLDWELSHLGDPLEDLGWLCAKAWRFGANDLPVGGFGGYDQLVAAYEEASGTVVDRAALAWWETLGTLKWAVICIVQARRHLTGAQRSVELAVLGRRTAESEWDLLRRV